MAREIPVDYRPAIGAERVFRVSILGDFTNWTGGVLGQLDRALS